MKTVFLDGNRIASAADMHAEFARALDFPEWYGSNLDALADMLSECNEEIGVILVNTDKLSHALNGMWTALLRLLVDIKHERESFHVLMEPFSSR